MGLVRKEVIEPGKLVKQSCERLYVKFALGRLTPLGCRGPFLIDVHIGGVV